jgi:2-amino-4-hydroxy-6-hydroxymethyldihydropteridine diphosphokinase
MNRVYLGIGGNMGDRWLQLQTCVSFLEKKIGIIISKSSIYKTKAWGVTNQQDFYNQVICLNTILEDEELLVNCQKIELQMGRIRYEKWAERIIDIDILFFNESIIHKPKCTIPHTLLHHRKFVLVPMAEIASNHFHPIFQKTISALLLMCDDDLEIEIVNE